ncbi:MAG: ABC transporter substrate-binding protein [Gammaproteobacteria bacterium RIFCSPHIGHO2_12_FULL_40_19]|nr:MAG: ABC transporter substrate-binding protein [Gammaproteobacteria bacterium RIFCSPHIGHO2_12_FULL_40_19]
MEFISSFREAMLNLLSAKLRSFLAILGVLVGTGSVVALISSSQLATAHALLQFKTLGTNLISLYLRDESTGEKSGQSKEFKLTDVEQLKKASSQIVLIAPYTIGFQSMFYGSTPINGQIIGATESFAKIAKVDLSSGRFVSYIDERNFFCVIGAKIADMIKKSTLNPLYTQIRVGDVFFTIVGVLKPWPENFFISADINNSIIIPLRASYFLDKDTHIDNILMRLIQNPNINLVKTQISATMTEMLPKKKIVFNSPEQLIHLIAKQRQTYTYLLIAIGSISLVVGGIGVMNIMLVSVVERRREIGIRMAIGARQSDILRMFLIESIMLTVFGGFLGVVFGIFTSYILAVFSHWHFYIYGAPVVLGFVVSLIVGIFSGFYPAWRASKLDPILAMLS